MSWLTRYSPRSVTPTPAALAFILITAAACADRGPTDPRDVATQRASTRIKPMKAGPGYGRSLSVTPETLTFGPQAPGSSSVPQIVTVTNISEIQHYILPVSVSSSFEQVNTCQGTFLAPGASCTIAVDYAPVAVGGYTGLLTVSSDAWDSPNLVTLNGAPSPWMYVTPTAIGFGSVALGNATSGRVVNVRNTGNTSFVVSSLTLGGTNPGDFLIDTDNCTGRSLNPGTSCAAYVSFEPTRIGTRSATVTIADNALNGPVVVSLTGTGVKGSGGYIP